MKASRVTSTRRATWRAITAAAVATLALPPAI